MNTLEIIRHKKALDPAIDEQGLNLRLGTNLLSRVLPQYQRLWQISEII